MNTLMAVWSKAISHESTACPKAFADDSMILANNVPTAQKAMEITGEFSTLTKQQLSAQKTIAWATTKEIRASLKRIR